MRTKFLLPILLAVSFTAWCQTRLDLRTQTKSVDFSAASITKPVKVGTTIPTTCSAGEMFFKSDAPAGTNLFGCTATNTWTLMSSTASGGSVSGPYYCADTGTVNAYACNSVAGVTAYTAGQLVLLKPAAVNTGASTLNVNGLGAKAIRKSGSQALAPNEFAAGQVISLVYDGTAFQVQALGIAGPQGPQGIQGIQGAQGAEGPIGPAGPAIGALLTTKGDTVVHNGITAVRSGVCPDGQVRIADSAQASGWRCGVVSGGSGSGGTGSLFCSASGVNTYACTAGTATQYDPGFAVSFQAGAANTGAATLNVNGLGAKPIYKFRDQNLEVNDIRSGQIVSVIYDGSAFQMQSERGTYVVPGGTLALKQDKTTFPQTIDIDTNLICLKTGACAPTGAFDLSGSSKTSPVRIGSSDPATCDATVREFFYNTTANALKVCNSQNTWAVITGGAGGGGAATIDTANRGWLCPLDLCPALQPGSQPMTGQSGAVFYVPIQPKVNYTIRRWLHQFGTSSSLPAGKGFAVGIYPITGGALIAQATATGAVGPWGAVEATFSSDVTLTAGTAYLVAYAVEDATTSIGSTFWAGHVAAYNTASRKLFGKCLQTASGTGASFGLPATCTPSTDPTGYNYATFMMLP